MRAIATDISKYLKAKNLMVEIREIIEAMNYTVVSDKDFDTMKLNKSIRYNYISESRYNLHKSRVNRNFIALQKILK